mmetsp:Transcript_5218/g.7760  ORF Transcript_5218/g.7760 Transcript_5218/m.7760 type:complete len:384 (-) Transcript_5218:307-1458(-)
MLFQLLLPLIGILSSSQYHPSVVEAFSVSSTVKTCHQLGSWSSFSLSYAATTGQTCCLSVINPSMQPRCHWRHQHLSSSFYQGVKPNGMILHSLSSTSSNPPPQEGNTYHLLSNKKKEASSWRQSMKLGLKTMKYYIIVRSSYELIVLALRNIFANTIMLSCGAFLATIIRQRQQRRTKEANSIDLNDASVNGHHHKEDRKLQKNEHQDIHPTKKARQENINGDDVARTTITREPVTVNGSYYVNGKSNNNINGDTANNSGNINGKKYDIIAAEKWAKSTLKSAQEREEKAQQQRILEKEKERKGKLWVENVAKISGINLPEYKSNHFEISGNDTIVWRNNGAGVFTVVKEKEERKKRAASLWVSNAMRVTGGEPLQSSPTTE